MFLLVFLSCGLTLALAGYSHYHVPHILNIGPHGVPIETPAVQAARAQHLAAHSKISSYNAWDPHNNYHEDYHNNYHDDYQYDNYNDDNQYDNYNDDNQYDNYNDDNQYNSHNEYNQHNKYHGPIHIPVIDAHGVPVEPHAVQAARAQHLAAHNKVYHGGHYSPVSHYATGIYGNGHYRKRRALGYNIYAQHAPVIGHHGVPTETPEVQAARAQHLAAVSKTSTHSSYNSYDNYNNDNQYNNYNDDNQYNNYDDDNQYNNYNDDNQYNDYNDDGHDYNEQSNYDGDNSVIGPHGVPIETPEVQAARAQHLAALSKASTHSSYNSYDNYNGDSQYNNHHQYNQHNKYHGPIHIPVIGPHGVPVEPHAVQVARTQHLASHNKVGGLYQGAHYAPASVGHHGHYNPTPVGHYSYGTGAYGNRAPVDTPEVQAAKAAHLAAHAAAQG